jgi:hypothetical protein
MSNEHPVFQPGIRRTYQKDNALPTVRRWTLSQGKGRAFLPGPLMPNLSLKRDA